MSTTKEMTEFLDEVIEFEKEGLTKDDEEYNEMVSENVAMLNEIKGKLERLESDDLIEKIVEVVEKCFTSYCSKHKHADAKAELRKLLKETK